MQNKPERAGAHPDLHLEYADEVTLFRALEGRQEL